MEKTPLLRIFVDVDETICLTPDNPREYSKAKPIHENIAKINALFDEGHEITYWTARGSRSGIDWYALTHEQLTAWGCKFNDLRCDKPYYDKFIDDKNLRIEEV